MLDDLRPAVTYVTRRSDWPRTALLGTLLVAAAGVVVPAVLLAGFAARVLRADRDDPLPEFTDLDDLAADGCRLAGVVGAYHAPPAALVLAGLRRSGPLGLGLLVGDLPFAARHPRSMPHVLGGPGLGAPSPDPVAAALLGIGALLTLPAGYLGAVAAVRVARTRRVGAGFDAGVLAAAGRRSTLAAWIVGALVLVVGRVAGALLGAVPVVGWLLAAAVGFHASTVAVRLWAVWLDRPARRAAPSPPGSDTPAGD